MDFQIEEKVDVVDIPVPSEILKGDWHGTVYAICTTYASKERHEEIVKEKIEAIKSEFDNKNHWSVSLRFVKQEMVVAYDRTDSYMTLVQFRVRDSY